MYQISFKVFMFFRHRFLYAKRVIESLFEEYKPVITIIRFLLNTQDVLVKLSYLQQRHVLENDQAIFLKFSRLFS